MTERASLREAYEQLRLVTENAPMAIAYYDAQMRCQYCNGAYARRFGLEPQQAIGRTMGDVIGAARYAQVEAQLQRVLAGERVNWGHVAERPDGSKVEEEVALHPRLDERGAVIGWFGFVFDVTESRRMADALRNSEARLRSLVNLSQDVFWETDAQHRFVQQSYSRVSAVWPPEVPEIGKTRWEVPYTAPEEEAWRRHRAQLDAHETFRDFELARPMPGGGERHVQVSGEPMFDENGAFSGYRGVGKDITARKKAEEARTQSEALFRAVFERSNAGLAIWAIDGRYLAVNTAFCQFVGYAADELIGKMTAGELRDPGDDEGLGMTGRMMSGEVAHMTRDRPYRRRDGRTAWGRTSTAAVKGRDGQPQYFIAVVIDVTEAREARARIEQFNLELEERIGERTAELRAALKELDSFAYSVSHDLRAPIGAVSGFSHLLRTNEGESLSADGRHLLGMIEKNAERAVNLIEGLLRLSQLGRAQIHRQPLSMRELVDEVVREVAGAAQAEVRCGDLPSCDGDVVLLRQVWANLLSNAIKYSRTREPARVEIGWDAARQAYFVRDNGVGFDMQYAGKLFGAFERLHGEAEFEGSGIGLAIVRRIVERHGGAIGADAAPDRGATFWFTVPGNR